MPNVKLKPMLIEEECAILLPDKQVWGDLAGRQATSTKSLTKPKDYFCRHPSKLDEQPKMNRAPK
jgi:hypothetical protein